ncbi:g4804 [Coccomyxa elongata]
MDFDLSAEVHCVPGAFSHNNSKSNALTYPFSNALTNSFAHPFSNALTYTFANALAHPFSNPFTNAIAHPVTNPVTNPFTNAIANPHSHADSHSHKVANSYTNPHSISNTNSHFDTKSYSISISHAHTNTYYHTKPHGYGCLLWLQDPVIPSPTPTPKSMLNAALYLQGPNIWPLTTDKLIIIVDSLADTMTTIQASDVNILNVAKAVATRRLLQSAATDSAAVVQVQMTGKSENQTNQIAQELGTVVSNTNLQRAMYQNGLVLTRLKVLSTTSSVPLASSGTCSQGSINGICIGVATGKISTTTIIIIAVCTGGGVLILALLLFIIFFWCVARKKRAAERKAGSAKATPKAMTPSTAYPYYDAKPMQFRGVKVRAEPPPGSPYPAAYSPHAPQEPAQAGASSSQPSTQLAVRSAKPATSLAAPTAEVIVDGDTYMEFIEMGGRTAREQLRMKLPTFGAAPAPRRTDSLLNEAIKSSEGTPSKLEPTPEEAAEENIAAKKGKQPKVE